MVNIDVSGTEMAIFSSFRAISGFGRAPEEPFWTFYAVSANSYVYRGTIGSQYNMREEVAVPGSKYDRFWDKNGHI